MYCIANKRSVAFKKSNLFLAGIYSIVQNVSIFEIPKGQMEIGIPCNNYSKTEQYICRGDISCIFEMQGHSNSSDCCAIDVEIFMRTPKPSLSLKTAETTCKDLSSLSYDPDPLIDALLRDLLSIETYADRNTVDFDPVRKLLSFPAHPPKACYASAWRRLVHRILIRPFHC